MFVIANLIESIANILDMVLGFYMYIIIARAILSWVSPDPYNPIVQFLYKVTEPLLDPIRRRIGGYSSGMDFSTMILIFGVIFLQRFLVPTLLGIAFQLR